MNTNHQSTVAIIGAGISGLAAGCYAQMNGYQAHIFEMHDKPGGLVTSWSRRGYLFDGSIDFLNGSNPKSRWHRIWQELGAAQGRKFVDHSEYMRISGQNGKELIVYTDIDRLEKHLLALSPADAPRIQEMVDSIRLLASFDPPLDPGPLPVFELPKAMRWVNSFNKLNEITLEKFASRFRDEFLRAALPRLMPEGIPLGSALAALALASNHSSGYPIGGSLAFSQSIADRFCRLGGQIHYKARVQRIRVEPHKRGKGGRAVGISLANWREIDAGWVISASDGYNTIFNLLNGAFVDETIMERYTKFEPTPPVVQVSLGVKRDLSGEPHHQVDLLRQPVYFAGENHPYLNYQVFNFEPRSAPPGHSVIWARIRSNHAFWKLLEDTPSRYEAEKLGVGEAVLQHLETRYPGISDDVEVMDVATPLTYERYTGNHEGVGQSFALTPATAPLASTGMEPVLPGLERFLHVGQWVQPNGGIFPAARSGREAVRRMCKEDGKKFTTTTA